MDPLSRSRMTPQERRVANLLARRRTNQEIAAELGISVNTVKTHVSMVLLKIGANNRRQVEYLIDVALD